MSGRAEHKRRSRASFRKGKYQARLFWASSSGMVIGAPESVTTVRRRRARS